MSTRSDKQPEATLDRIDNPNSATITTRAVEAIRAAIADGRLVVDERYSVARLAERFGVSRTPVREALLLLERQGMVRFERNRGVRVLHTTVHDLEEIFNLRLLLEVPATRHACKLLNQEQLATLELEVNGMRRVAADGDVPAFMQHDARFHETLLDAAGNFRLTAFVDQLRDLVRFRGASTIGRSRDLNTIVQEHVAILDALRARDAAGAAKAMRRHLQTTGQLLIAQEGHPVGELGWGGDAEVT